MHVLPLHQNHIYTDLPPYLLGAVPQSSLKCCLPGCSPHFAPDKSYSHLSRCAFFKSTVTRTGPEGLLVTGFDLHSPTRGHTRGFVLMSPHWRPSPKFSSASGLMSCVAGSRQGTFCSNSKAAVPGFLTQWEPRPSTTCPATRLAVGMGDSWYFSIQLESRSPSFMGALKASPSVCLLDNCSACLSTSELCLSISWPWSGAECVPGIQGRNQECGSFGRTDFALTCIFFF